MVYELPSQGVLEINCIRKASPWSRFPLYCIPQAQGLMQIHGRDWIGFYVWTNGSSLFRLYRDDDYWDAMKMALSELSSLKPAPRHELCGYLVYASKRVVDNFRLLMWEIHGKLVS